MLSQLGMIIRVPLPRATERLVGFVDIMYHIVYLEALLVLRVPHPTQVGIVYGFALPGQKTQCIELTIVQLLVVR